MFESYFDCIKNKRLNYDALCYKLNYKVNLTKLYKDVNSRLWIPGIPDVFIIKDPVPREIYSSSLDCRVLNHYLCNRLEDLLESTVNKDAYSSRKGKGNLKAVIDLYDELITIPNIESCYFVKLDFKRFFSSIPRNLFFKSISEFIENNYHLEDKEELLYICDKLIHRNIETNFIRKSELEDWELLDEGKSLIGTNGEYGLVIGDLYAQRIVNLFLKPIDDWLDSHSEILIKKRYVDDIILVIRDKSFLYKLPELRVELSKLGIKLNESKFYCQPVPRGVQFLGRFITLKGIHVGKRSKNKLKLLISTYNRYRVNLKTVVLLQMSINSYYGLFKGILDYYEYIKYVTSLKSDYFKFMYILNGVMTIKKRYRKDANRLRLKILID